MLFYWVCLIYIWIFEYLNGLKEQLQTTENKKFQAKPKKVKTSNGSKTFCPEAFIMLFYITCWFKWHHI